MDLQNAGKSANHTLSCPLSPSNEGPLIMAACLTARSLRRPIVLLLCALAGAAGPLSQTRADDAPVLWASGVKPCSDFLAIAPPDVTVQAIGGESYRHYREWLAGLVTGLNLATGRDVLKGADLDAAMIRIRANCERNPREDFFNASMRLFNALGDPDGD